MGVWCSFCGVGLYVLQCKLKKPQGASALCNMRKPAPRVPWCQQPRSDMWFTCLAVSVSHWCLMVGARAATLRGTCRGSLGSCLADKAVLHV